MLIVTSREVQSHYGEFIESVEDDLVCVTRHGRPLFWAVSDRQVRSDDPSILVGRLLLLNGQLRKQKGLERGVDPTALQDFLAQEVDSSLNTKLTTPEELSKLIHASRK